LIRLHVRAVLAYVALFGSPLGCSGLSPGGFPPAVPASSTFSPDAEEASEPPQADQNLPSPRPLDEPPSELLEERDEDAGAGLSLEEAIERLIWANADLAAKYQDIPKARADVLTAGLRNDPVVFVSASPISYGRFSVQRPGATSYDITLVQSLDVSGKHKANKRVAEKNIPILEARYQDAVRREIDRLHGVFVNVLEARAAARAARGHCKRWTETVELCRQQVRDGRRPQSAAARAALRQAQARIALRRAETALLHARRNLAVLLALPADKADRLRLRGTLAERPAEPPCLNELIALALRVRPDLRAYRLSVERAQAEVQREKAEALEDVFVFFSPYQAVDLTPQGKQVASSWEFGLLLPIPAFNRNQGEIARARINVGQWRMEVERAEAEVVDEVRRALTEYTVSRQAARQYERDILPPVRGLRAEKFRRFREDGTDLKDCLAAQRDYEETVRDYVETLARHRRAMLRLNVAVGQRIFP
jgi:cobalt-zinc-cadmium efflux system outer membrane protein